MQTVPPVLTLVNSLVPMTTRGDRLRAYLLAKTGGRPGWQGALVEKTGVKRQTISKYTSPKFDRYPDLGTLATLAAGVGVEPFEIVAAMDGETALSLSNPQTRQLLVLLMDEWAASRGIPTSRQGPRTTDGAT
jgi:transcriptional regulator with XRE-family HTH domain